jgi:hypothetical protein
LVLDPANEIDKIRKSSLVKRIISLDADTAPNLYRIKVRVELKNGWFVDFFERRSPDKRRYSYHVFRKDGKMIIRWDNAPHYPNLSTFPHHKHRGRTIEESVEVSTTDVLRELGVLIK